MSSSDEFRKWKPTAGWCCLWPVVRPLRGTCVCRLWAVTWTASRLSFSDESALEVCIHDDARSAIQIDGPYLYLTLLQWTNNSNGKRGMNGVTTSRLYFAPSHGRVAKVERVFQAVGSHRHRSREGGGGRGHVPPKIREKYFSGN